MKSWSDQLQTCQSLYYQRARRHAPDKEKRRLEERAGILRPRKGVSRKERRQEEDLMCLPQASEVL